MIPPGVLTIDYDPAGGLTLICNHPDCGGTVVVEFPDDDGSAGTAADAAEVFTDALDHLREHQ